MAIDLIVSVLLLTALIAFAYGPWQEVVTDYARQHMFEKRDRLFDMALAGELSFKSAEYRELRSSIEACIRFAHEISFPRMLSLGFLLRRLGVKVGRQSDADAAVARITNQETKEKLLKITSSVQRTLAIMLVVKSPFLMLVLSPFIALVLLLGMIGIAFEGLRQACRQLGRFVQIEAENAPSPTGRAGCT